MMATTALEPVPTSASSELVAGWERLADELDASPFLHPGFVIAWWRAFGHAPLQAAVARREGRIVGLLPLVARRGVIGSPANWHMAETGVLAEDEQTAAALAHAVLAERPRRVAFAFVERDSSWAATLRQAIAEAGWPSIERSLQNAPFVELDGDWEAFEQALPARERKEQRRRARRLSEQGRVWLDVDDGSERLEARLEELVRVEGLGWKGEQGTAIGSQPATLQFYGDVARWAAARGCLRLQALRLDDAPIAVAFALELHGVQYSLKIGYDPAHRSAGPGVAMMREVVRRAFEDGIRGIELLGGEDRHKALWSSGVRERVVIQAFSPSMAGRRDRLVFTHVRPLAKRLNAQRLLARLPGQDRPRV
jgi:CelD/BcsL family acetyltransferase involved in cellulose biosynthesis